MRNMTIEISLEEYQTIRSGLLGLPAKSVLEFLSKLDKQVIEQNKTKSLPMASIGE